jgi:hypothetical protein
MDHSGFVEPPKRYALVAEYDTPEALMDAANKARLGGYKKMDAYSPFPIHGLDEAIGFRDSKIPWIVFGAGLLGAAGGFMLQWYTSVIDYPMNVGGRPLNSLPAFFPVTYECTILFAGLAAAVGMLALNGLPKPYHSVFNTPGFDRASQDRFFLAIEATDPMYREAETRDFLQSTQALNVSEVDE